MVYKDLLTESTPEQQSSAADLEFVELDDVPVEKIRSILEENEESRVEPSTPQIKVRQSSRPTKAPERYYFFFCTIYCWLTSGELECFEEALQVEAKDKSEFAMNDEMESLMKN